MAALPRSPTLSGPHQLKESVMQKKRTLRGGAVAVVMLAALAVTSAAPAHGIAMVTIRHDMRGCHSWSLNNGPYKPSLTINVRAGTVLSFTNNDIMPHKLLQTRGPNVRLIHPSMNKMASTARVTLVKRGVYRFTTKPGEDYPWAAAMKTVGADNVLHLTVRVN
jgi:plastocyanin